MRRIVKLGVLSFLAAAFLCSSALAQVEIEEKQVQLEKKRYFKKGMQEFGISGGYGAGQEDEFISDFIVMPKWGYILADFDGPLPGAFEVELEAMGGMFITPERAMEAAINLLFTYNFETGTRFVPFFSAGAGFLYTNLDVNELGSKFNGSPQGGIGVKYFLDDTTALSVMGRIRHISNAGTASPNRGVDQGFILFGIDFLR